MKKLLVTEEAAELTRLSVRSLHGLASARAVPHRKLVGVRRLFWDEDDLTAWLCGAPLEVVELEGGGRIVRPKGAGS